LIISRYVSLLPIFSGRYHAAAFDMLLSPSDGIAPPTPPVFAAVDRRKDAITVKIARRAFFRCLTIHLRLILIRRLLPLRRFRCQMPDAIFDIFAASICCTDASCFALLAADAILPPPVIDAAIDTIVFGVLR